MEKQTVYIVFEDDVCRGAGQLAGQSLYELIDFDDSQGDITAFYLTHIPRMGESIELPLKGGSLLPFEISAVHHRVNPFVDSKISQTFRLLLKQVIDWDKKWYF